MSIVSVGIDLAKNVRFNEWIGITLPRAEDGRLTKTPSWLTMRATRVDKP